MAAPPPARPCAVDVYDAHPLEMIPWFRRYPPGPLRDLVYTFIWNTLLAAIFAVLGMLWAGKVPWWRFLWWNFVFAQAIGYTIHLLFALAGAVPGRVIRHQGAMRFVFYAGIPVVGVIVGYLIAATLLGWLQFRATLITPRGLVSLALVGLLISGLIAAVLLPRERAARAEAAMANERARAAAAEREAALAQMKALEAQVEPHFLYNTLAHVASLIDSDPPAAHAMLDKLIALLRETTRSGSIPPTLGGQADHVSAWLAILALRMGPRLAWRVDVPPDLRDASVPPALLQPLVENAVKHGLEPKVEGGRIEVSARRDGEDLVVAVADTGNGFGGTAAPLGGSTGVGLAGLRSRLAALYGERARVAITEGRPSGVVVTVRVPLGLAT